MRAAARAASQPACPAPPARWEVPEAVAVPTRLDLTGLVLAGPVDTLTLEPLLATLWPNLFALTAIYHITR